MQLLRNRLVVVIKLLIAPIFFLNIEAFDSSLLHVSLENPNSNHMKTHYLFLSVLSRKDWD